MYDWLTLGTAVVGVAIVAISTIITAYQAVIMRRELDSALDQQRSWVRIDMEPAGPLIIDKQGARLAVDLSLTNTGSLPALGAWAGVSAEPHPPLPEGFTDELPEPGRSWICDGKVYPGSGLTIFPGETVKTRAVLNVDRRRIDEFSGVSLAFAARACTAYSDGRHPSVHHTDRTFVISNKTGGFEGGFNKVLDHVPTHGLAMTAPPSGNYAD